MRFSIVPLILVLLAEGAGRGGAQAAGDATKGFEFVQSTCSDCHAVRRGQRSSPNAAAPSFQLVANVPGMTELALRTFLRTSHKTMPNLMLTDQQLDDVVAHILSLRLDR